MKNDLEKPLIHTSSLRQVDLIHDLGYSQKGLGAMTFLVFWTSMTNNFDHGGVPAALEDMKKDLKLSTLQMGSMGTMLFIGPVFGSIFATCLIDKLSYKINMFLSVLSIGIAFFLLTMTSNFNLLLVARFTSGFWQSFISVYAPIFVDAFSSGSQRDCWLPVMQVAP